MRIKPNGTIEEWPGGEFTSWLRSLRKRFCELSSDRNAVAAFDKVIGEAIKQHQDRSITGRRPT